MWFPAVPNFPLPSPFLLLPSSPSVSVSSLWGRSVPHDDWIIPRDEDVNYSVTMSWIQEACGFGETKWMPSLAPDNLGSRSKEEMLPEWGLLACFHNVRCMCSADSLHRDRRAEVSIGSKLISALWLYREEAVCRAGVWGWRGEEGHLPLWTFWILYNPYIFSSIFVFFHLVLICLGEQHPLPL